MKVVGNETVEGRVQLLVSLINLVKHFQLYPVGIYAFQWVCSGRQVEKGEMDRPVAWD